MNETLNKVTTAPRPRALASMAPKRLLIDGKWVDSAIVICSSTRRFSLAAAK